MSRILNEKLQKLIMFRGTIEEIENKLNSYGFRDYCKMEKFENGLDGNDFGFNINLGQEDNMYLDYEVFMLETNQTDVYIITEINDY